jgi:hypothetical protein
MIHKSHGDMASNAALIFFSDGDNHAVSPGESPGLAKRNGVAQIPDGDFNPGRERFLRRKKFNGDGKSLRPDVRVQRFINFLQVHAFLLFFKPGL